MAIYIYICPCNEYSMARKEQCLLQGPVRHAARLGAGPAHIIALKCATLLPFVKLIYMHVLRRAVRNEL